MLVRHTVTSVNAETTYTPAVMILGKVIGTCTGWDLSSDAGTEEVYYNFIPFPGIGLPFGDLFVNYGKATLDFYDQNGEVTFSAPISLAGQGMDHKP